MTWNNTCLQAPPPLSLTQLCLIVPLKFLHSGIRAATPLPPLTVFIEKLSPADLLAPYWDLIHSHLRNSSPLLSLFGLVTQVAMDAQLHLSLKPECFPNQNACRGAPRSESSMDDTHLTASLGGGGGVMSQTLWEAPHSLSAMNNERLKKSFSFC